MWTECGSPRSGAARNNTPELAAISELHREELRSMLTKGTVAYATTVYSSSTRWVFQILLFYLKLVTVSEFTFSFITFAGWKFSRPNDRALPRADAGCYPADSAAPVPGATMPAHPSDLKVCRKTLHFCLQVKPLLYSFFSPFSIHLRRSKCLPAA